MVCRVLHVQMWISEVGMRKKGLARDGRWIGGIGEKMGEKMGGKMGEERCEG